MLYIAVNNLAGSGYGNGYLLGLDSRTLAPRYKVRLKEGYFPMPPMDTGHNLRSEMVDVMLKMGIPVESHHHEVATAGQAEIDMQFQPLLKMADQFMWYKYICKNVAKRRVRSVPAAG